MIESHRTKSLQKCKMNHYDGLENKRSANPLHSFMAVQGCLQMQIQLQKETLVDNWSTKISPKAKITYVEQKVLSQILYIPHEGRRPAQCKSNCQEHAGSDKRFENTTLFLDQLPHKIQFTKEKITLKILVLSREAKTLPQCKSRAARNKLVLTKIVA